TSAAGSCLQSLAPSRRLAVPVCTPWSQSVPCRGQAGESSRLPGEPTCCCELPEGFLLGLLSSSSRQR
uniref:Uncharacterized protein n=1 Tax=Otolemur garnettii TaxID=30611 RepID=H0XZH1_OTOGA